MWTNRSSTIKYVPKSASNSHKDELSEGGIAGIVIAGIVVIAVIVAAIVAYFIYRNTVNPYPIAYYELACLLYFNFHVGEVSKLER